MKKNRFRIDYRTFSRWGGGWMVGVILASAVGVQASILTVYNQSTNTVTAVLDGASYDVSVGQFETITVSAPGDLVIGTWTNGVTSSVDWSCWVGNEEITLLSGESDFRKWWPWFAGGMGTGLLFYGFGWQLRMVRNIGGRHVDI